MKLGLLSGVSKEALESCFEMARFESPLVGSRLVIQEIPVTVHCTNCAAVRQIDFIQLFCCPVCGVPVSEIVSDKELEVVALEILE